nr:ARID DNA-binding domain-containing protein [Tanacetum cinerariifolium]
MLKPSVTEVKEKLKYPERVHVITYYMVKGSDNGNWDNIWYISRAYKRHMGPTKSLFKRMINRFKMEDVEEKERKFIFSYEVGETIVETKEGKLYMFDDERKAVDVQGDSTMAEEDSGSIEDLKMDKEDVQDYIDDEYLSMNGTLYAMKQDVLGNLPPVIGAVKVDLLGLYKLVDNLGGYMNVTFRNKWKKVEQLLGLTQDDEEAVKESYKEYIGMVKIYYEEAQRSKQEEGPKGKVVGNSSGTAHEKNPLGNAGMSVEIGTALEGTPKKTAQVGVKMESNKDTADKDKQGSTSSSDDFIVIT